MATISAPRLDKTASAAKKKGNGHARFFDYLGVAIDSLRANKLRSFLTLLGIIIGIASIISVASIIQGLDRYWKAKVSNFGPNTFVVTQYPIITNFDKLYEAIRRNPEVHAEDADAIRRYCTSCEAIGVETHKVINVRYGKETLEQVDLGGSTPNILDIEPYDVEMGRAILDWEDVHSRFVTFVGWDIAEKLFHGVDPIGKTVRIDDHTYTIVGVAEKKGTVLGFSRDNFVKIPLSTFQKIYGSRRTVNISIRAREGEMQQAEDQAKLVMRTRHKLDYKED